MGIMEEWATQENSDDHLQSDSFAVLLGAGCLMSRPPEIVIYTVSRSTELEA